MRFSSFNTLLDLLSSNAFLEKLSIPQISVSFFEICDVGTLVMNIHKEIYPYLAIHQLWIANSLTSFYILATCFNQCVETWQFFRFFFEKAGNIWQIIIFLKEYSPSKECCPRSESPLILIPVLGPGCAPTFIYLHLSSVVS